MRKPQLDQATICEVVKETLGETRGSVVSAPRKHTRTTLPQQMIRAIIQRCYPPDGRVPDEVSTQTVCEQVDAGWAEECNKRAVKKRKSPSWTTIARYLGRRK
jgi:hypothetical protein